MSTVYLIRHGQGGLRQSYDALSQLGHAQGYRAGQYLAGEGIVFKAVYSGSLRRQCETAAEACRAYRDAGLAVPDPTIDRNWDEFDLDQVYRDLAPAMGAADPQFRRDYEQLERLIEDESSPVHRAWSPVDVAIVRAWVEGHHPTREPWEDFRRRVSAALDTLGTYQPADAVAVFTSATPIALWAGMSLGLNDGRILKLAGVLLNTAVTIIRIRERDCRLFSFNNVPHLSPEMRTFR